jgi:hypothetical protein
MIAMVRDLLLGNTQAQPDMPTANDGLIAVVGENVQAQTGANFRQVVTRGASAITGSPPNTDRYLEGTPAYSKPRELAPVPLVVLSRPPLYS